MLVVVFGVVRMVVHGSVVVTVRVCVLAAGVRAVFVVVVVVAVIVFVRVDHAVRVRMLVEVLFVHARLFVAKRGDHPQGPGGPGGPPFRRSTAGGPCR
ncbi:MAG: hypothetical protein NVS4B13_11130 [Candidatus Elarobacter sp.]